MRDNKRRGKLLRGLGKVFEGLGGQRIEWRGELAGGGARETVGALAHARR
jgi:hypothetical protein